MVNSCITSTGFSKTKKASDHSAKAIIIKPLQVTACEIPVDQHGYRCIFRVYDIHVNQISACYVHIMPSKFMSSKIWSQTEHQLMQ